MTLVKHGTGEIIRDSKTKTASASSGMSEEDAAALQAENDAADKEEK